MIYEDEQKEILDCSDKLDKVSGRSWNRYRGDVVMRKIIELANKHLSGNFKMVGPNVFIEGLPTEFDALVVRTHAQPLPGTNTYRGDDVAIVLEIKKHGFYYKKTEGEYKIRRYFEQFYAAQKSFIYITVKESQKFIDMTRIALGDDAFFLCRSGGNSIANEWQRFVERILALAP